MKVGRLRHRITLQHRADIETPEGEVVPSWADTADVWGSIEPMSGREYFAAQQVNSEVTARILIRWRAGIESAGRVLHQTNQSNSPAEYDVYDIISALTDPVIGKRWITLLVVKRASQGFRSGE